MRFRLLLVALVAIAALVGAVGASAKKPKPPKIVLKPTSAMVNSNVVVKGKRFPADTMLTIAECGRTMWVAAQDECADNAVTVTTNARGAFKTTIKAALCPQDTPPTLTEETCYVGRLMPSGIDTVALDPSAPLEVSWP
jgi:hypothetical protein